MRSARRLPALLAGLAALAIAALAVLVAGRLVGPLPFDWDRALIAASRGGPAWLRDAAVAVTALGGGTVLTTVVVVSAAWLLVRRLWLTALVLIAASWSGGQVVRLVKQAVGRARPDIADRLVPVVHASFPSGHAANSAIVYLSLAALASQVVKDPAVRRGLFATAIALSAAIGASRVYLGVHWPSDVLAGWSFGALWALGWWWIAARTRIAVGGER